MTVFVLTVTLAVTNMGSSLIIEYDTIKQITVFIHNGNIPDLAA